MFRERKYNNRHIVKTVSVPTLDNEIKYNVNHWTPSTLVELNKYMINKNLNSKNQNENIEIPENEAIPPLEKIYIEMHPGQKTMLNNIKDTFVIKNAKQIVQKICEKCLCRNKNKYQRSRHGEI